MKYVSNNNNNNTMMMMTILFTLASTTILDSKFSKRVAGKYRAIV
jgi:hypothetical protein